MRDLVVLLRVHGDFVAVGADLGLGLGHSDHCRPLSRGMGHHVDEGDLDVVGHPIQGHVLPTKALGLPPLLEQ